MPIGAQLDRTVIRLCFARWTQCIIPLPQCVLTFAAMLFFFRCVFSTLDGINLIYYSHFNWKCANREALVKEAFAAS